MNEAQLRAMMVEHGRSLFERGYVAGQGGNISAKTDDALLMTPTNSCLSRLDAEAISKVSMDGRLISGQAVSKSLIFQRRAGLAGGVRRKGRPGGHRMVLPGPGGSRRQSGN